MVSLLYSLWYRLKDAARAVVRGALPAMRRVVPIAALVAMVLCAMHGLNGGWVVAAFLFGHLTSKRHMPTANEMFLQLMRGGQASSTTNGADQREEADRWSG